MSLVKRWPKARQQEVEEGTPAALTNGAGENHTAIPAEQDTSMDKQLTIAGKVPCPAQCPFATSLTLLLGYGGSRASPSRADCTAL